MQSGIVHWQRVLDGFFMKQKMNMHSSSDHFVCVCEPHFGLLVRSVGLWCECVLLTFWFIFQYNLYCISLIYEEEQKNAHKNDRSTLAIRMKMSIICSNISRQMFNVTHTLTEMQQTLSYDDGQKMLHFLFAFFRHNLLLRLMYGKYMRL